VENLGFHLKRNFVVHAGHPKNSAVRVPKRVRLADEEQKKNMGVDFGVGIS
jgi:hypothetical protein